MRNGLFMVTLSSRLLLTAGLLALSLAVASPARAQLGPNLIVNGGAESYTGGPDAVADFTGWTRTGRVYQNRYSTFPITFVGGGPLPDFGKGYFLGGDEAHTQLQQVIDLSSQAVSIDGGTVTYSLQGWMGGRDQWSGQEDTAQLSALFLDAGGNTLASAFLLPLTDAELALAGPNISAMNLRTASGIIPSSVRSVTLDLDFQRYFGVINNGAADNLSLQISTVPEPGAVAFAALSGVSVFGLIARKRRKG